MNNKVVARFVDGRTVKGTTVDFLPGKDVFHVIDAAAPAGATPQTVRVQDLKAVFFVKNLEGDPHRTKQQGPAAPRPAYGGRRIRVEFKDGEILEGVTTGYQPERQGFFVEPADPDANEERCYVLTAAAKDISFI